MSTIQSDVFEQFRSRPWVTLPDLEVYMRAKRSLLTLNERKLLYWLTKEYYTGEEAGLDYIDTIIRKLEMAEYERNFMKIVRKTIDIWTKGDAYEKEMAIKF